MANKEEYEIARSPELLALHFPKCDGLSVAKVYGLGFYMCLSILCMEIVDFRGMSLKDYPRWASMIDCYQVGYNKDRKIVAFDFSRSAC